MQPKGLQPSSNARQNAKARQNFGVQRKRSRSEVEVIQQDVSTDEKNPGGGRTKRPIIFPNRVAKNRPNQLEIDVRNLPQITKSFEYEVTDVCYEEMRQVELEYRPDPDYLQRQRSLNPRMRAVLLDWMIEVAQEYGLKRDSLHFAINYVDRYLSDRPTSVPKNELQLIGVTALWMASKMEEILPPPCWEFAAATDGGCTAQQMLEMEGRLVQALKWKLVPCTAYAFVNYYLQTLAFIGRRRAQGEPVQDLRDPKPWMVATLVPPWQMTRVMEILDFAMLDIDSLCFPPSMIAATAVLCLVERDPASILTVEDVEDVSVYSREELSDCKEWFSFALNLQSAPAYTFRASVLTSTPHNELQTIQRHNPSAMTMIKDVLAQRGGRRHESAERFLRESVAAHDSDEDIELSSITTRSHPGLLATMSHAQGVQRAFSPMTNISMQLENTSLGNVLNARRMSTASPQRRIRFEDENQDVRRDDENHEVVLYAAI